ncbi:MAG: PEP/pyruvate-binding domain-containing protein [Bacteroidota bacterium]
MLHRLLSILLLCVGTLTAQTDVAALIDKFQDDPRGPYRDIRWYCADGTIVPSIEGGCATPDEGNKQHASYKREVIDLGRNEHIFLGQILTNTSQAAFWDAENNHSRTAQYLLGNYLVAVDNGWVNRKGQFYRGAIQVEDEMAWGRAFLNWLMGQETVVREQFYLLRQVVGDIPHRKDNNLTQKIRNDSRAIADKYPKFMDLRIKIHGQPEGKDAQAVQTFLDANREEMKDRGLVELAKQLSANIRAAYVDRDWVADIVAINATIPEKNQLKDQIATFAKWHAPEEGRPNVIDRITAAATLMEDIRLGLLDESPYYRLEAVDVSLALEQIIFQEAGNWQPATPRELTEKICYLAQAAAGAGFVENWEFTVAQPQMADMNSRYVWPTMVDDYLAGASRFLEWGAATNRAAFGEVVERYAAFEPKAKGFLDDRIRGSVLLPLGNAVGKLGDWAVAIGNSENAFLDVPNQGRLRGLNPGYARGTLHVIDRAEEDLRVNPADIYVFALPPADLKPVGGIATVSEGNMVSHVQLLARNLGIPNAVLTSEQFVALRQYDGQEVFYAVSNGGTIVMKKTSDMTEAETALFAKKERSYERLTVPIENIRLDVNQVLNMRQVRSKDSGKLCGPKAANLGQLKALFPDKVVEGLVIPFGVFREHLNQPMPGQGGQSYWRFINGRFGVAREMEAQGKSEAEVEAYTLKQLTTLREAIGKIKLYPSLIEALRDSFRTAFGGGLGEVPVFLRSDTNMEDLADFTGAGLNKTVFNVVDETGILEGIRAVWASPYTERSYRWRQRYLNNPENVFPSILIIPSVDVDYSGVMITKGVATGQENEVTVAFSRGAGGAVDGQAAEAYLLDQYGRFNLLSPARERLHRRLPKTGGSVMVPANFNERILSHANLVDLWDLAADVERIMPESPGVEAEGPWDVELGFQDDKIYLFQIRPFVENKQALASGYLASIDPPALEGIYFDLESALE